MAVLEVLLIRELINAQVRFCQNSESTIISGKKNSRTRKWVCYKYRHKLQNYTLDLKLDAVSWTTGDDGSYSASHTLKMKNSRKKIEGTWNIDEHDRSPAIVRVCECLSLSLSLSLRFTLWWSVQKPLEAEKKNPVVIEQGRSYVCQPITFLHVS